MNYQRLFLVTNKDINLNALKITNKNKINLLIFNAKNLMSLLTISLGIFIGYHRRKNT